MLKLTIDAQPTEVPEGNTVLDACRLIGIYIPTLCHHPDLQPAHGSGSSDIIYRGERKIENARPGEAAKGCGLCVVEIEGEAELKASCSTEVRAGMVVVTDNERIRSKRRENLIPILSMHPHACLTCAQQEGCSRSQCSSNVPQGERCCAKFGHCELQAVAKYVGISPQIPKWVPTNLPRLEEDPLFTRDYDLCIGCTRCVRACRDLRGVEALGLVYDPSGQVQVGTLKPGLGESGCRFCTACVEVCPTGALTDKALRPGRKAEDLVPCKEACPAHIDIPGYLRLIAQGRRDEALAVIREKVPFPGILGRVCVHPCEKACRRGEVNEAVSICALKRFASDGDQGFWKKKGEKAPDTGKKVAVVGAGPGGLTAAYYLRKAGHSVSLLEHREKPGGMMRYGIPRYRLPEDLLEKEIREIMDLGIPFVPNRSLGRDFTLEQLRKEGFDAVFLAVGARLSRRILLEGAELPDVLWGVDFLGRITEGNPVQIKNRVVVIGGGNVAVDVALTALRSGATEVGMVCLERREEMPAHPWEIQGALAEGVRIMPSWGPERILSEQGQVTGVELVHCTAVFDAQGLFNPSFDDARKTMAADQIILAIGQATDLSSLEGEPEISTRNGLIVVNRETLETGKRGVYAGGDVTSVPGAIIHAIEAGRRAASSIDKALGGDGIIEETLFEKDHPHQRLGREEGFWSRPREKVPELDPKLRHEGFQEVLLGFSNEQAEREASRCLQCDLRLTMGSNPSPPEKHLAFTRENVNHAPETEGVFQLYDEERSLLALKGTPNLKKELLRALEENEKAKWFEFEEDKMYSKRESELIQKYLQEHGQMPGGGSDDDDLF